MSEPIDSGLETSPTEDDVTAEASQQSQLEEAAAVPANVANVGWLLVAFAVAAVLLNAMTGVAYWVGDAATVAHESAYHEKVLTHLNPQQGHLVALDRAAISNYAVIDASAGQYKVPIAQAMHLIATDEGGSEQ